MTEDLDVAGGDAHLLVGLSQGGIDGAGVDGIGATTREGDVARMGRHRVGALGENHPDVAGGILVERHQHRSKRYITGGR